MLLNVDMEFDANDNDLKREIVQKKIKKCINIKFPFTSVEVMNELGGAPESNHSRINREFAATINCMPNLVVPMAVRCVINVIHVNLVTRALAPMSMTHYSI